MNKQLEQVQQLFANAKKVGEGVTGKTNFRPIITRLNSSKSVALIVNAVDAYLLTMDKMDVAAGVIHLKRHTSQGDYVLWEENDEDLDRNMLFEILGKKNGCFADGAKVEVWRLA